MEISEKIKNLIQQALLEIGIEAPKILLEHPTDLSHGDYSSNVALMAAKSAGANPKELATKIAQELVRKGDGDIEDVEVAGAGFINFHLSKQFYNNALNTILLIIKK